MKHAVVEEAGLCNCCRLLLCPDCVPALINSPRKAAVSDGATRVVIRSCRSPVDTRTLLELFSWREPPSCHCTAFIKRFTCM